MAQRMFTLTQAAARALQAAYQATDEGPYRTRLQAVRLYGLGSSTDDLTQITGAARSSLMEWCRAYGVGGVGALTDHRRGGNSAKLTNEQVADLSNKLRLYTPRSLVGPQAASEDRQAWTVEDVRQAVKDWYGVSYQSTVCYYTLFTRCAFRYHQPSKVFKSRNEAAVAEFEAELEKN